MAKRACLFVLTLGVLLCACGVNNPTTVNQSTDEIVETTETAAAAELINSQSNSSIKEPQSGTYIADRIVNKNRGSEQLVNETPWENIFLDVKDDGTCTYIAKNKSVAGTWSYVNDTVYISIPGKIDCYGTVKNGVMYLNNCPTDDYNALLFLDGAEINEADIPHVYHPSTTEIAYNHAMNINLKECEKKANGRYQYYTIDYDTVLFRAEDCHEIQGMLFINKDAFFNIFALSIDKFLSETDNDYTFYNDHYFSTTLGLYNKPDTRAEALKSVKKVSSFMRPDVERAEILKVIEQLSVTEGVFDYNNEKYEFIISDIGKASKELGISEEMLGYTIAYLSGGNNIITFDDNSISYQSK